MGEINTNTGFDDVKALLADLAALDIHLKVADGKLGYDAPPGAFTEALKERVRALRAALLVHLCGANSVLAPLSSSQERMWFLNRLEVQHGGTRGGSYTEHLAFSLNGPLDRSALEKALSAISARHGALRTRFREGTYGPEQVVAPPTPLCLPVVDLSAVPQTLDQALHETAHRLIDLATDPHVRFTLFALAAGGHVLSVSAHHAAWDGWSNGIFTADLATAYNALRTDRAPALPPLLHDVADLARAQRAALANGSLDKPLQQLCRALQGFPTRLELPTDRPHPAIADGRGAALNLRLEPAAAAALAAAARRSGATPFMAVLAAWALLLSRLSGQSRLLIGTPVAAREDTAEEAVIGYLSNTMVIPVDVGAADSFGALVVQIRDRVLAIMAEQRVPFEKLVETLAPPHSRATTPLIQTIFAMQPCFVPAPALDGLSVSVLPRHNEAARYELMLNLETTPDNALEGPLIYATALFDHATVSGWADHLLNFLRAAPQQWEQPLDRSPLGKIQSAPAIPATVPASPRSGAPFATATERALAAIWGELLQTAPTCRDDDFFMLGGHSLLLMRVIHRVNSSGLGHLELAEALGATQLSAMAALLDTTSQPNSPSDQPAPLPEAQLRQITESFNPPAMPYSRDASIADLWRAAASQHASRIALTGPDGASMTYAALDARAEAIAAALHATGPMDPTVALAVERGFDAVAAILGIWKAGAAYLPLDAKLPPRVVRQLMDDADAKLILGDAKNVPRLADLGAPVLRLDALPPAPTAVPPVARHGGDPAYVMFTSGTTGRAKGVVVPHRGIARLALNHDLLDMPPGEVVAQLAPLAFDATTFELWSALLNGATLHIIPDRDALEPARLGAALRQGGVTTLWLTAGLFNRAADEAPGIFAGLRRLITGGETLSLPHARRVMQVCPEVLLCNAYGPTENCCFTTLHPIVPADLDSPVPIGRPIAQSRVYIVDEQLQPVPIGVWGELVCAGDGVALGYAGLPEQTAAAFVTLPWGAGERVYRSGDVARWRPDGAIEFGGRRDGQVKIRGHRIETAAIEAVLAECDGIRDAAVIVTGEGAEQTLVACVAADGNSAENAWRTRLAEHLPIYMMPARFVVLPTLPVNVNGKRDRQALQAHVAALTAPPAVITANTAEGLLTRLFTEFFPGVAIDRDANFFHLGGHSLLLSRLATQLRQESGQKIPLLALLEAATVAGMAALLTGPVLPESLPGSSLPLPVADPDGSFPLSSGQERLWVIQRIFPDSGVYNVPLFFDVDGPLDSDVLARALSALEERHHALRLRVFDGADGLRQRLAPTGSLTLARLDLRGESDPVAAANARQAAELVRPFQLDREAGARALLMRLGDAQWRVLLVLHHAIFDGWSVDILTRDLEAFYAGTANALPPPPAMQFEDFATWQRSFTASAEGQALLARRRHLLTPLPPVLSLPTDHPRPPLKTFRGETLEFAFSAGQTIALDALARACSATPFALVTALVQALLYRLTGQHDLVLGTLVAGRDRPELQDTVGFFVNTLALRQKLDPTGSFRQLLADTRSTCLQAIADQHCLFETLVEALGVPRDLGHNPLFDIMVVWQSNDLAPPRLPGLTTRAAPVLYPFAKLDLTFHFGRRDGQIICQIEHSTELFEAENIARLFARLETLAAAVLSDPDHPLGTLPVLPAAERQRVVEQFNATALALETQRTVMRPFLDRLATAPSAPAVLWKGEAPLDYRHFAARAGALARHLVAAGVQPGETVAVCAPRSPELLIAIYGILMAGGAYAPLGTDQPAARIAGMLEDLGNPRVLVVPDCRERVAGARSLDLSQLSEGEAEALDLGTPDSLAYVLFTSGSTGRPKGVAIEQHAVLNRILWMQSAFPIGPGDVILQKTPVTFDVSVWELFWWSWTGAAVALPLPGAERDPLELVDQIERDGVTVLHFVPSMLAAFLNCLDDGRADARRLRGLRYVFASGEALDPALAERFDRLLHRPFGIALHNLYGPTEATVDVTWQPCSPWTGGETVPIGRPIANTTVFLLDGDGQPVPIGIAGEIHLGGPQVARGYVNQPGLTQERFLPDPFAGHGRLYRTGDLGRWRHDGAIEYLGRIDQQVKIRGQRIEPGEIEHALEAHPAVERAVVVAVTVQGAAELHAYVLAREALSSAVLRGHLRTRVSEAMVPARFFRMTSLPLSSSGKLDRQALSGTPLDRADPPTATNLRAEEKQKRLTDWNKTSAPLPETCLHQRFEAQAAQTPEATALVFGNTTLTYAELNARANQRAHQLIGLGVGPDVRVAIALERSPDMIVALLATLKAGGAYVPLDPDYPDDRLTFMLADCDAKVLITEERFASRWASASPRRVTIEDSAAASFPSTKPGTAVAPSHLAYIIYTSGSTGQPKGVAVEHRNVTPLFFNNRPQFDFSEQDVWILSHSFCFDFSVWEMYGALLHGGRLIIPRREEVRDIARYVQIVRETGVTVLNQTPAAFYGFIAEALKQPHDWGAQLRYVIFGGDRLEPAYLRPWAERFPAVALINMYGITETTVHVTFHRLTADDLAHVGKSPIGRPLAETTVYLCDPDRHRVPVGTPGEMLVGGSGVARGYLNRPELTAEHFVADPFSPIPGARLYKSGDLARYLPDGQLEFLGRIDHQVKIRGFRIELREIEAALAAHPDIRETVVRAQPEASGDQRLVAYFVATAAPPAASALRAFLKTTLPDYMLPAAYVCVPVLPLTSNGKVDRQALASLPQEPGGPATAGTLSDVEAEIRAIWKTLLPDTEPGLHDGFFDAGGNSLLVIRLHQRLNTRWPGLITITDLFSCATIAEQARRVAPHSHPQPYQTAPANAPLPAENNPAGRHAVAIVGMALRMPGSDSLADFWRDVSTAADRVRPLPPAREAETRALLAMLGLPEPQRFSEAAFLDDILNFDPKRLRLSPADAALLDPEQRLFLDTALRALEDAGRGGTALDNARVGVFIGGAPDPMWRTALMRGAAAQRLEQLFVLNVPSNIATRLSFLHNWRGPAALIDTACSSSLVAVHTACRALRAGECDWALAGGAKTILLPHADGERISIDSSDGRTHAFADDADGTGMGEGSAVFLLRPLADALAEGDAIHGVILGSAVNQDGASSGMAAPNPAAQAEVIATAARDAGVSLASLSYIEAHGTGTVLGDPVEIDGLTRAFALDTAETGFAAIGSGKGNYGHLDAAAGALGMARAVLCLTHDQAPPQPFFKASNPRIDFAKAPVAVTPVLAPLADRGTPRRAGISGFGLSGINAHVVIEAAPPGVRTHSCSGWITVGLSAPDAASLQRYAGALVTVLREHPDWPLADIARTLNEGRDGLEARLAVWVRDRGDLLARLAVFAAAPDAVDDLRLTGTAARARNSETISTVHANKAAARAAATAFVAGARLVWPQEIAAGHLHLPPAPLSRRRCAPELAPAPATKVSTTWLGPAATTPQGRFYPLDVHSPVFWPSAEHRLDGAPTLVGMAFPALLAEAMPESALCLRDLHWIRPLRPAELKPGSVTLAIAPDGAASLTGQTLDGRWLSFVKAALETSEASAETLELDTLAKRCEAPRDAPPFQPQSGIVTVSARWNCLQRYASGQNEALAWLRRPDGDATLRLHPGLLDVAVGQALDEFGLVPTACDRILIHGVLPAEPVAHLVRRTTADGAEADIRLADRASGQIAVSLLGLHFTRLGSAPASGIVPSLPRWDPAPLDARDPGGPVVLIGEGPLAERLAATLAATGRLAAHCSSTAIDETLRACLAAAETPAIVFAPASGNDAGIRAAAAMRTLLAALRHPTRLLALGQGAFAVDDTQPLDPFQALTYGIVAAATLEEPLLTARYIDCDDATDATALLTELAGLERDPRAVAWRAGQRLIRRFEPLASGTDPASWPNTGCCVVSGGTGGLALMLAETLAADGRVALALLSRSGEPASEAYDAAPRRQKIDALRAAGLRLKLYACDVADRASLAATLARIRQELGPITAVVHNAGVPDGAFLANSERSVTAYAEGLATKVTGTCLLDALTASDPVQAFVLAGSLTALTGAPGHAAYTGANAFLDAFAVQRRRRGQPALTIDWCGIRGMGMLARRLKGQPVDVDAGDADVGPLFHQALASGAAQISLIIPEVRALLIPPPAKQTAARPSPPTAAEAPAARRTGGKALEAALATIWADVLGYDTVAPDDDFYALGGDSIAGMQIVRQIISDLGQAMTLADLFETGTIAALAERLRTRTAEQHPQSQGLSPAPRRDRYPLAWEQLAVVQAEAAADMGTAYNLPSGLFLPEDVDRSRLRAAADRLIERHEILRTRLIPAASENGEPTMQILPPAPAVFETLEVPDEAGLLAALNASVRPFDLWAGVPMRFVLGSVAGKPRALVLDVHHALADAFSMEVLLAELAALYAGTVEPAPIVHLKDYAWWSREGEGAAAPEAARAYWRERFQGPLPVLDLPADRPRPARHTWRSECVEFAITGDTIQRLRTFAAQMRTTPFAVVTATWALLLARYARLEELVLAVPVDSRDGAGMAGMTGMLVSLLPLRLTVNNGENLAELIQRTHASHSEALRHRSYGLGRLLADLAPPSAPDRPLLSEATLSYMNFAEGGGQARGTSGMTPFGLGRSDGKSDLAIFVRDLPEQMVMAVEYYADLFDHERMERMGRHLRTLLTALVSADPATPVAQLPLIDAEETAWLAAAGQGATPPLPLARGLFGVFADCVASAPEAIALEGSGCRLTYSELHQRAGGIAAHLRTAGVLPGDRVALHVERNAEAIVLLLGIVAAGATYVPLDPAYPAERVAWIVQDAACRIVVADAAGRALLPAGCPVLAAENLAGATANHFEPPPTEGPAYVLYTSGSTGTPKGVIVPQAAVLRLALGGGDLAIAAEDRLMQAGPLAFDASTFEIWGALLNGARLCVASRDEVLDPAALATALTRYGITVLWMTTGLFNRQVDVAPESFKALRAVLTGGETASTPHIARALSACPGVPFFNAYGPTENTTFTTTHRIAPADTQPGPVPIGRSIAHTWVAVLEPGGTPAPTGVWGEIVAGGLGLADDYLNRADLTAERFVTDATGRRGYRTGDLGRWRADGVLEFGGRSDNQIKLRGFRIELEEIEQALNGHPAIAASAALFLRDIHGEGSIVACLQSTSEAPSTAALRDWLGQRLPAYMVPRRFVMLTELPVNSNGKVDRVRLTASLPPPDPQETAGDPPRNGNERLIADLFAEVFGQPVDSRDAHFLDLGGHSLLAIKVVNRLAQTTGVRLSMRDFFSAPTVAGLAALIAEGDTAGETIPRLPEAPSYPASHAQARLYLASRMEGSETAYNITFALPFAGRLDLEALRSALRQLLARHETLRTGFVEEDGNIRQRVAPELEIALALDDLSATTDPRAEALRLARREAATAFDLATPPLLRARVLCLEHPENWLVMLVLHHIVGDGWSSRILLQELASLYRTAKDGALPTLPALPIAYRDFAAWHNRQDWTATAAHWRTALAGAPDRIALPTDRPVPAVQSHRGDSVSRLLPAALSAGLADYALRRGVTMASLGLALFAGLLYRLTRQGDLVIGMGVAGRDRAEVEGLIGFFVNILPLRLHLDDETEFEPLVAQVHATLMTAMDHRDFPFDLLVRAVAPRRAANRQPLINVIYEYHRFDDGTANAADENIFGAGRPIAPDFGQAIEEAIRTPTAKHDLLLFLTERQDGCELLLEYDTDLFDRATAERWLGYLEQFALMVTKPLSPGQSQ